ncbi:MAG: hypothetical protein KGZ74_02650 [Chitinophagaceae bacterium]|nr:hypothetical protein [Chitinophagaceae bacterium]
MKQFFFLFCLFAATYSFAQDTTKTKPKQWLGVLTLEEKYKEEKNWTANDQAIVGQHFQRLVKMKEAGTVVLAGRMDLPLNDPEMKGLVIFYAKDEKEALDFMLNDPAVKNKIMIAKVFPYGIAVSTCK